MNGAGQIPETVRLAADSELWVIDDLAVIYSNSPEGKERALLVGEWWARMRSSTEPPQPSP